MSGPERDPNAKHPDRYEIHDCYNPNRYADERKNSLYGGIRKKVNVNEARPKENFSKTNTGPQTIGELAERVARDAESKHTDVFNSLHPANKPGYVKEEDAFDRMARGAEAIGREMRSYGVGVDKMNPEDPYR